MNPQLLLTALAYIWAAFGAYWIVIVRRSHSRPTTHSWLRPVSLTIGFGVLVYLRSRVSPLLLTCLILLWAIAGLFWDRVEENQELSEHSALRLLRLCILAVTFALLFWDKTAIGFLGQRFVTALPALASTGFALAILGLLLALWARIHLGAYWSDKVMLQADHQLIRSGPYAHLRHPIYSGVLLAVFGTALVLGQWRGLFAFALLLTNYAIKAKREERILAERFGQAFREHRTGAGFLLPKLRV